MAPVHTTCPLRIRLFRPFEVQLHGEPLPPLRTRKVQWLLALLVLRHGREVERDWLAGLLWPDRRLRRRQWRMRWSANRSYNDLHG